MKPGELRANSKNILTDEKRRYYSKILDPSVLLINPGLAKKVCRRSGKKVSRRASSRRGHTGPREIVQKSAGVL
jgi:hypothetical protein